MKTTLCTQILTPGRKLVHLKTCKKLAVLPQDHWAIQKRSGSSLFCQFYITKYDSSERIPGCSLYQCYDRTSKIINDQYTETKRNHHILPVVTKSSSRIQTTLSPICSRPTSRLNCLARSLKFHLSVQKRPCATLLTSCREVAMSTKKFDSCIVQGSIDDYKTGWIQTHPHLWSFLTRIWYLLRHLCMSAPIRKHTYPCR